MVSCVLHCRPTSLKMPFAIRLRGTGEKNSNCSSGREHRSSHLVREWPALATERTASVPVCRPATNCPSETAGSAVVPPVTTTRREPLRPALRPVTTAIDLQVGYATCNPFAQRCIVHLLEPSLDLPKSSSDFERQRPNLAETLHKEEAFAHGLPSYLFGPIDAGEHHHDCLSREWDALPIVGIPRIRKEGDITDPPVGLECRRALFAPHLLTATSETDTYIAKSSRCIHLRLSFPSTSFQRLRFNRSPRIYFAYWIHIRLSSRVTRRNTNTHHGQCMTGQGRWMEAKAIGILGPHFDAVPGLIQSGASSMVWE
ncbi:hypothetical protein GE09DRAFT_339650 [Coniochaeta sp. 2T2.1]|nr:hypothetical protein GE09DRAFT_339650 [Coniochaeta sp. 2T2.1]